MTCEQLTSFLDEYLAGSIDAPTGEVFERHLAVCADCRHYLAGYRISIELSRQAFGGAEDVSAGEAPEVLISAVLATLATIHPVRPV